MADFAVGLGGLAVPHLVIALPVLAGREAVALFEITLEMAQIVDADLLITSLTQRKVVTSNLAARCILTSF